MQLQFFACLYADIFFLSIFDKFIVFLLLYSISFMKKANYRSYWVNFFIIVIVLEYHKFISEKMHVILLCYYLMASANETK